jgi:hypothetical protein
MHDGGLIVTRCPAVVCISRSWDEVDGSRATKGARKVRCLSCSHEFTCSSAARDRTLPQG